jgi:hypothetical protein
MGSFNQEEKLYRAKKKVEELKKFYVHLGVYLAVNLFISIRALYFDVQNGYSVSEILTDLGTYWLWIFWGIGVVFHAFKVFGFNVLFGNDWEDRKIKEFMDNNKNK